MQTPGVLALALYSLFDSNFDLYFNSGFWEFSISSELPEAIHADFQNNS